MSIIIGVQEENTKVTERRDSINMLLTCFILHWQIQKHVYWKYQVKHSCNIHQHSQIAVMVFLTTSLNSRFKAHTE